MVLARRTHVDILVTTKPSFSYKIKWWYEYILSRVYNLVAIRLSVNIYVWAPIIYTYDTFLAQVLRQTT